MLILGAKNIIQKNTVGHAIRSLSNQGKKKLLPSNVKSIMKAETNALVQKDIKKANIISGTPDIFYL